MAKVVTKKASGPPAKSKVYGYPSRFGSHSSMVKEALGEGEGALPIIGVINCVCEDEYGLYVTERSRLDSGLADPNRYAVNRLGKLFEKTVKEDK